MTKPGYTHIIVPKPLHDQLKVLAQQNNMSISVSLNIGINTGINTATLNRRKIRSKQAPKQKRIQK